ncbi:MAG: acetylxylan esterase [Clostridiales bacterium]|nr:acetylxylan esterase [Clostridiales bacterium]
MKDSEYSPDLFMDKLYASHRAQPYAQTKNAEEALKVGADIRERAKQLFNLDALCDISAPFSTEKRGEPVDFGSFAMQKYSVRVCENLQTAVYILTPKTVRQPVPGVVALCGHGYGVRQILGISGNGRKKHLRYFDNYQKSFALELARRGCIVAAPELFGFGEARLKKDLAKPFYASSCKELSHHLLPYSLTTASVRVLQAIACASLLSEKPEVDTSRLACMGISGGGLTALYASVLDERFKRIVVSGYINTFRDSILSLWHCPDNYIPGILSIGEIYDFACALAPRELLIESGTRDKIFPIEASRLAHKKIAEIYSLVGASDKLHTDVFDGKHQVSGKQAFDFLSGK